MKIKEIELYNFRIYKGLNTINLLPEGEKNVSIVSGKNGFGKTTFLMSLVWCLYGKKMGHVDELYKKEISDTGGYSKYIANSLNRQARYDGDTRFHVAITLVDVEIPELPCREIKIMRSFDVETSGADELQIFVDGEVNQLVEDLDNRQIFIQDFILPEEIAKFFFFDAEKIVSLAETKSNEQSKELSRAYAEVLRIKRYEDLRDELEKMREDYRQKSANIKERTSFNELITKIANAEAEEREYTEAIEEFNDKKDGLVYEANQIQEKLIRAGTSITVDELNKLKDKRAFLQSRQEEVKDQLRKLMDNAPLAIGGNLLLQVNNQIEEENNYKKQKYQYEDVENKSNGILDELDVLRINTKFAVPVEVQEFYHDAIRKLIKKHFFKDVKEVSSDFKVLHDFSDVQQNELQGFLNNLKLSFKDNFRHISKEYSRVKTELQELGKRILDAEAKEDDPVIKDYREQKQALDKQIKEIEAQINDYYQKLGQLRNEKVVLGRTKSELSKKIELTEKFKEKDDLAKRLISELNDFIQKFKLEKKRSLEDRILGGLTQLMHKKNFIKKVEVDIIHENIDIRLYNGRNEEIPKEQLSKGEQQLYATSLLKGLVEESNIAFPVFIDSPMQKFDEDHARKIIENFYPSVSEQVVILPLINKEMNQGEFEILLPSISHTYLIVNRKEDHSEFVQVKAQELFKQYEVVHAN